MTLQEAYKTLGLNQGASEKDITSAFRKLAAQYHPDKNPGNKEAEEKFKKISNAYDILKDPSKADGAMRGGLDPNMGFDPTSDFMNFVMNFGGMGGMPGGGNFSNSTIRNVPPPSVVLNLTFNESVLGATKKIAFKKQVKCNACDGNGSFVGSNKCKSCNGRGTTTSTNKAMVFISTCGACRGTGRKVTPCTECNKQGFKVEDVESDANIPGGVHDRQILKGRGAGHFVGKHFGQDAYNDLHIRIRVQKDKDMSHDGKDVISSIDISLLDALKGTTKTVRTVKGDAELNISKSIKNGDKLYLQGYGVNEKGNHIFIVNVNYPKDTDRLIEFLSKE